MIATVIRIVVVAYRYGAYSATAVVANSAIEEIGIYYFCLIKLYINKKQQQKTEKLMNYFEDTTMDMDIHQVERTCNRAVIHRRPFTRQDRPIRAERTCNRAAILVAIAANPAPFIRYP